MDVHTRGAAAEKAEAVDVKIGYPDFIMDEPALAAYYAAVEIRPGGGHYFENFLAANAAEQAREARKLGHPVDRREWGTHRGARPSAGNLILVIRWAKSPVTAGGLLGFPGNGSS
jgi:predicted metalloendopeptidase